MLVCNVSMRPRRAAIPAAITETAAAASTATGIILFNVLVDDPAFATDSVNAFSGVIMLEAASASDTVGVAGSVLTGAIVEAASATDTVIIAASVYGALVAETATAADLVDASSTSATVTRSAMLPSVFVNADTSREANADGIMVNI